MVNDINHKKALHSSKGAGFTMIELLTAFGMFAVVMSLVAGIFVLSVKSQKNISRLLSANNNVYLMLEQMAREMRVGTDFTFVRFGSTINEIYFTNPEGDVVGYRMQGTAMWRILTPSGQPTVSQQISSNDINVIDFFINNNCNTGQDYPVRVTLHLKIGATGTTGVENILTEIQTTTAVRNLSTC